MISAFVLIALGQVTSSCGPGKTCTARTFIVNQSGQLGTQGLANSSATSNLLISSATNSTTATAATSAILLKCIASLTAGDLCFLVEDNGGNDLLSVDATGRVTAFSSFALTNSNRIFVSGTAPTISSGFGTSPSISSTGTTAAFRINVGTGGTATSGVIGLPAATAGWNCWCSDITTPATAHICKTTASTTTSATISNYSGGVLTAWTASDILAVSCFAF